MAKSKNVADLEDSPSSLQEHGGGGSPKKKKKKKKRSESQEDEAVATSQSFSSPSSSGLSPKKKKKKRKKEEEDEEVELNANINGGFEKDEEMGTGKKKNKKKKKKKEEEKKEEKILLVEKEMRNIEEKEVLRKKKNKKEKVKEKEIDPKKKSKEGKMRRREEEEEHNEAKSSPKKKVKKEKMPFAPYTAADDDDAFPHKDDWKIEVVDEEIDMDFDVDEVWPEEVTKELLSRVMCQLPKRDSRSARVSLKFVDWEKAAIPGRSPEICQQHFMALYKKINSFKTLTTMIEDMRKLAASGLGDNRNRPLLPMHRFFKDFFTTEVKAEAKRRGVNLLKFGLDAWKDLPAEEKQEYIRPYEQEYSKMKKSKLQKTRPAIECPKLPYQLCWELEKEAAGTQKNSRSYYSSLTPRKQLPYIQKALEDAMKYETDLQSHKASYPDYQPPTCHAVSKTDLKTYLDLRGCPALPPRRAHLLFFKEAIEDGELHKEPGMNIMAEAMKMFKNLSSQEKEKYNKKLKQSLLQYEQQLNEWLSGQDEVALYALKKLRDMVPFTLPKEQKRTRQIKKEDFFPHKVPAGTTCPKFLAEPPRPPASPYRLFTIKFRTSIDKSLSGPELRRALSDGWKALTEEQKTLYVNRCSSLHQLYEKELKAYVQEMDPKTRKLFLGFNRVPLFRFFGNRDIFAEDFPHSEKYPVLVKGVQEPHPPTNYYKYTTEEEDDEDEDREEDMVSATPSPKKRTLKVLPHPLSETDDEEEEEEAKQFTSAFHLAAPYTTQSKKKAPVRSKKNKAVPVAPAHQSEDESSEEEEEAVTPAWRSGPPTLVIPVQLKKKVPVHSKKNKAVPVAPAHQSEDESSEEEEEAVTPAWRSGPPTLVTPTQPKKQKQKHDSSSSGFSDSDSSI